MVFFMQGMILVPRLVTGKPPTISGQEKDLYIYIFSCYHVYTVLYTSPIFNTCSIGRCCVHPKQFPSNIAQH